ncbi:MAG TPA: acetyl-CoA carboxylase biotin carboxyl carrier protein [Polyangia bacterium]|jgi:acetyl-CoA carboxylase biotin carboxyl carrier protein
MSKQGQGQGKDQKSKSSLKVVAAAPARRGGNGGIDFESVRELARIAAEFDLAEVEADGSGHVRVRRGGGGAVDVMPAMSGPRPIALTPAAPAAAPVAEAAGTFISSPFVGTFYRAPSPEAPMFVDVGQAVRKGQVVCIVEAMKLMNEIEAESEGKIEEILVQNGEHVEYGQHLFRLSK